MRTYKKITKALCIAALFVSSSLFAAEIEPTQIQMNNLTIEQLQQAAQAGDPDAQYALGYMYYYGKGVPQDRQNAYNWIKRASVQGQGQATKAMTLLGLDPSPAPVAAEPIIVQKSKDSAENPTTTAASKTKGEKNYTIQLLSSSNKKVLEQYSKTNHLAGEATIYTTKRNGKSWYVLGYGKYKDAAEAKGMIKKLPASMQAIKPFVKSIESLESKG